uniref:PDZ domain-containing protein n=1 Tax=Alexandrium monilatum TaxID=311494 RepID=A0A7S4T8R3_9DINO|mmetsp:Transcript_85737/g.255577  ORF Transcript_85737/g.255577 Transcript_85737/m.255577 type:complete len:177 (+) Transcript_85737:49-579(+)
METLATSFPWLCCCSGSTSQKDVLASPGPGAPGLPSSLDFSGPASASKPAGVKGLASTEDQCSYFQNHDDGNACQARATPEVYFEVRIQKTRDRDKLGIDIVKNGDAQLRVERVKDGLIQDWNRAQTVDGKRVAPGDNLIAVNDVSGCCKELLWAAAHNDNLRLRFTHPPDEPPKP